jgi:hypothetical protein
MLLVVDHDSATQLSSEGVSRVGTILGFHLRMPGHLNGELQSEPLTPIELPNHWRKRS